MIIKQPDQRDQEISKLESLLLKTEKKVHSEINQRIRNIKSGIKAENQAKYYIDFAYKSHPDFYVLHDLRLVVNDRVAQFDHVIFHRSMNVYIVETKHFHAGFKVTSHGEFLRWDAFRKTYVAMNSPILQNERHVQVLKDAFNYIELPTWPLFGRIVPKVWSLIAVSEAAKIYRDQGVKTPNVVKVDAVPKYVEDHLSQNSNILKNVFPEEIEAVAKRIASYHFPAEQDYDQLYAPHLLLERPTAKSPRSQSAQPLSPSIDPQEVEIPHHTVEASSVPCPSDHEKTSAETPETAVSHPAKACKHCSSSDIELFKGRMGFYVKCKACEQRTGFPKKCSCGSRLKTILKDGQLINVCGSCSTETLLLTHDPNVPVKTENTTDATDEVLVITRPDVEIVPLEPTIVLPELPSANCKHCASEDVELFKGGFGYYFKCKPCGQNTGFPKKCSCGGKLRSGFNETHLINTCLSCGAESSLFKYDATSAVITEKSEKTVARSSNLIENLITPS